MCNWKIIIFKDDKKNEILKVYQLDSIKQIELSAIQSIKSQASFKLNDYIHNYFSKLYI